MESELEELVRRFSEVGAKDDQHVALAVQRTLLEADEETSRRRLHELAEEIENSRVLAILEIALTRASTTRDSPRALRLWHAGGGAEATSADFWKSLYARCLPGQTLRGAILRLASRVREEAALDMVVEALVNDPPALPELIDEALVEWFAAPRGTLAERLPALARAVRHPSCTAAVLDLAHWALREKILERHPCLDDANFFASSLAIVTTKLRRLVATGVGDERAEKVSSEIERAIALCVSLIDALGWMKRDDERATEALRDALTLPHRRLQTEAAAALARRGDARGVERLADLAVDPAARLRAVKYARELGVESALPDQTLTDVALREAELATWLAHPRAMGMAPTHIEFAARQRLPWAGSDEPVDYMLFRVEYRLGDSTYENLAFAAPTPFATASDLTRLSTFDACALLFGWHAEHDSIRRRAVDDAELARWKRELDAAADGGATLERAEFAGDVFEERCLVGRFERDGVVGWGVIVRGEPGLAYWHPTGAAPRPLTAAEAFAVWLGRKFFAAFGVDSEAAEE